MFGLNEGPVCLCINKLLLLMGPKRENIGKRIYFLLQLLMLPGGSFDLLQTQASQSLNQAADKQYLSLS